MQERRQIRRFHEAAASRTMTMRILFFLGLLAVHCQSAKTDTPAFGTTNGYDSGGTAPVCFESIYSPYESGVTDVVGNSSGLFFDEEQSLREPRANNTVEFLNDSLFESGLGVEMLSSCYNGTDLTVAPLELPERVLYLEETYTFRLNLQVRLSEINVTQNLKRVEGGATIFHVRLQLCNALRQGFCNPMKDTRLLDETITPADTDLDADVDLEFDSGDNKWFYQEGTTLLGMTTFNGDIIFSRWCKWTLRESDVDEDVYKTEIDISLQLPLGTPTGAYFFLGHAVLDFELEDGGLQRIDIAEAIPDNVVEVKRPAKIHTVSQSVKITVGVVSGLGAFIAACMLGFLVYHHKHQVMKLAQGSFLAAMAAAAVVQMGFTFTTFPTTDFNCRFSGLFLQVPLTFMGAVLVGRLWRIYCTLGVASKFGRTKTRVNTAGDAFMGFLSCLASFPMCISCGGGYSQRESIVRRRSSLRSVVTPAETWRLIAVLTTPQVLFQVFAVSYFDRGLETELTESELVGRVVCSHESNWTDSVGAALVAIVFVVAVVVAWISRSLPSAFNEKEQVFNAANFSAVLALMSIALTQITNDPSTKPDVEVFVRALCSIGIAGSVLRLIIWGKIARVLSGEKVVVSALLASRYSSNEYSIPKDQKPSTVSDYEEPTQDVLSMSMRPRITVQQDDPLPRKIETQILCLQNLLQGVVAKGGDGRPLSVDEWNQLRAEVASLKGDLDLVDLNFQGTPESSQP